MNKKQAIPIFAVVFTNVLGGSIILPILPLLAEQGFGATAFQATAIATAFFAAQFFAAPIMGRISDRTGRRPLLLISQVGTVIAFVIFIFAAEIGVWIDSLGVAIGMGGGLLTLYIARTLDGITGGNISIAQAYISDVSDTESRTKALGFIGVAYGLGIVFGPIIGSFTAPIGLRVPFIVAAILTIVSLLLTYFFLQESLPPEKRSHRQPERVARLDAAQLRAVTPILLVVFAYMMTFSVLVSTFSLFANRVIFPEIDEVSQVVWYVGFILSLFGIGSAASQAAVLPALLKRLNEREIILSGLVSLMVGFAGMAVAESVWAVVGLVLFLAYGMGILQPCLQALLTFHGNDQTNGRLLGLFESVRSLAFIIAPLWAGGVFDLVSPHAPYAVAAGLVLVGFLIAARAIRQPSPAAHPIKGVLSS